MLVARIRSGDPEAFEELVRLHSPSVYRVAAGMVGSHEAEDVVQDVYMVAHEKVAEFRGRSSLRTWLCGVAAKQSLQRLRRQRRWSWFGSLEGAAAEPVTHEGPQSASLASERVAAVASAIASLPEEQRAVVVLRAYEGLSFPEIAAALSIRVPTAESRMARAKVALRGLLEHLEPSSRASGSQA